MNSVTVSLNEGVTNRHKTTKHEGTFRIDSQSGALVIEVAGRAVTTFNPSMWESVKRSGLNTGLLLSRFHVENAGHGTTAVVAIAADVLQNGALVFLAEDGTAIAAFGPRAWVSYDRLSS